VDRYLSFLRRYEHWWSAADAPQKPISATPLQATRADVETYIGIYAHHRKLKPQSRMGEVAALRSFYRFVKSRGLVSDNVTEELKYPRFGRTLPKALALGDADKLLMAPGIKTLQGMRDTSMIGLLIGSGMRLSGLMSMTQRSLLWASEEGIDRLTVRVTEKGKKERLIPVPAEIGVLVRAYMGHEEYRAIDRQLPNGDAVLWVTLAKQVPAHEYIGAQRRMSGRTFQDLFRRYAEKAGIPEGYRKPHAARHLYGTELAESEVDVIARQSLLGHSSPKTTEIYTHMAARKLRQLAERANPISKLANPLLNDLRALAKATQPKRT